MPIKHLRDHQEIGCLAAELSGRWNKGHGIEPWLRSLEPELSIKVRYERWSWASIAEALNGAGVLYATGRLWTGQSLARKMASIRYEGSQQVRRGGEMPQSPASPPPSSPLTDAPVGHPEAAVIPPAAMTAAAVEDDEPEFRPAALKGWSGTKIDRKEDKRPASKAAPAAAPMIDAQQVIARLLGKK